MRKMVRGHVRVEVLFTPADLDHLDICARIAKTTRVELVRRLARRAYADAVKCNLVNQEKDNEQPHQAPA